MESQFYWSDFWLPAKIFGYVTKTTVEMNDNQIAAVWSLDTYFGENEIAHQTYEWYLKTLNVS